MEKLKKKFLSPVVLSILSSNKSLLIVVLVGIILIGFGALYFKSGGFNGGTKVEVLESPTQSPESGELTVEISGEVIKPGVYKLPNGSRVEDLIVVSGGYSANANRDYLDKYLNRAAKIIDGQKIYIPSVDEQTLGLSAKETVVDQTISSPFSSDSKGLININSASLDQLDKLPGIGPVYGQSIIDHRPYSTVEELVTKGALKQNVFIKLKDLVSVY